jgi:hypothetical protein
MPMTWGSSTASPCTAQIRILCSPPPPLDCDHVATWTGDWVRVFQDDCLDVVLDPQDSSIVYLGVRSRGLFKSFTSGDEWTSDPILPFDPVTASSQVIKIALGLRNVNGTMQSPTARTLVVRFGNEVSVSTTSGEGGAGTWQRVVPVIMGNNPTPPPPAIDLAPGFLSGGNTRRSDTSPRRGNEWCNCLAVDPFNPDHILTGSVALIESTDSGATWTRRASAHEDEHSVVFDDERQGLAISRTTAASSPRSTAVAVGPT